MKKKSDMTRIEIDENSGFCFGVVNAIRKAEEELAKTGRLYCLGDIVHNNSEVVRLQEKGLVTIDHETFARLHDVKVLLRAHGEPPETYRIARENRIEIIDATCPVVLQLQRKIKQSYEQSDPEKEQFEPGGLAQLLRQKMPEELRAGQSLCGPHREDLDLLLDGQPTKVYASQGQQRSVVLSLKMAEAAAAASITGEHPVMLLDDVLSELDDGRKQYLLTRMREKQTFVTSCDDTAFLKTDGEVYRMNGGVLTKV